MSSHIYSAVSWSWRVQSAVIVSVFHVNLVFLAVLKCFLTVNKVSRSLWWTLLLPLLSDYTPELPVWISTYLHTFSFYIRLVPVLVWIQCWFWNHCFVFQGSNWFLIRKTGSRLAPTFCCSRKTTPGLGRGYHDHWPSNSLWLTYNENLTHILYVYTHTDDAASWLGFGSSYSWLRLTSGECHPSYL